MSERRVVSGERPARLVGGPLTPDVVQAAALSAA